MYGGETELEAPGCRGDNPALLSRMTNATWEWAKTVLTQVSGGCIVLISVARAPLYVGCSKKYVLSRTPLNNNKLSITSLSADR